MGKLRQLWDDLRSSLWFVPTLLVLSHVLLAIGLIEAETFVEREQLTTRWPRLFGAGAEGSREMLAAIAGSMITVAGVAFSVTVVTFALASSQYTSRVLRNFMRDRSNQAVLGVFLGVFAYCLVVLRTIRGGDSSEFVPSLAVLGAVLLGFVAIGFLVFFIHHTAASIQASNIIEAAAQETLHAIDSQFPDPDDGGEHPAGRDLHTAGGGWSVLPARSTGYIQGIESGTLEELAGKLGTLIRLEKGIGDFVIEATPLGYVLGTEAGEDLIRKVNAACSVGRYRTVQQDAAFGIRQIEDIAIKALSPGINDSTTAVICIDFLGAILVRLAPRRLAGSSSSDGEQSRVILPGPTFAGLLGEAFDQIRQNGEGKVAILTRLLEVLKIIADRTKNPGRRRELIQHAALVMEVAERTVPSDHDREGIKAAMERFLKALNVTDPTRGA